jgi:ATP-dependent Clp protease ATP-binding subunit ClpX
LLNTFMPKETSVIPTNCSFCEKSRQEVTKLIVNGNYAICDECVKLCGTLLITPTDVRDPKDRQQLKHINPMKIKEHLDQRVVGQDQAKIALSVGVANHYKRLFFRTAVRVDKSNVMLLGPTGSGKTLLAKSIAEYLNVPFVIADVTGLTEAGYVGDDVDSIISRLLDAADGNVELAQQGIVFLDEIDKIGRKSEGQVSRDIGGEGVQQSLLKMIEGTVISVPTEGSRRHPGGSTVDVDTSGILFIASGAFVGVQEIVQRRHRTGIMGFSLSETPDVAAGLIPEDLIKFGLIPEFVGRFPVIVNTVALTEQQLIDVLTKPQHNLISQYKFYFDVDGVPVEFTDDALRVIAHRAVALKTGARALRGILELSLMPHLFALPRYKQQKVSQILFTAEVFSEGRDPIITYKQSKLSKTKVVKSK